MSEPRIVNIIEFLDRSSRVINLKIRLRMTALHIYIYITYHSSWNLTRQGIHMALQFLEPY